MTHADASPRRETWRGALAPVAAFSLIFTLLGLVEAARATGDSASGLLLYSVGLAGLWGLVLGSSAAMLLPAHVRLWRRSWAELLHPGKSRDTDAGRLRGATAHVVALAVAAVPLLVVAAMAGRLAHGFVQVGLAQAFTGLGALAGAGLGALVFSPARDVAAALLARIVPTGRIAGFSLPLALAGVAVVGGAATLGLMLTRLDLGAWRLGWLMELGLGCALAMTVSLMAPTRRFLSTAVGPAIVLVTIALAGMSLNGFSDAETARRVIPKEGGLSRIAVSVLRALADRDGDGASAALGGGDCDDSNAEVGPMAAEVPGNGVDDNCEGGDAPPELAAEETPPAADASAVAPTSAPSSTPGAAGAAGAKRWNILLILIDTLRPDHLSLYGYDRPTSPNLDAFARSALVFENVVASAPNTPRSMPSIFTGRYPSRIAWVNRFANYGALKPENETLFELLAGAGYHTEVQSAHWYWDKVPELKRGVARWDNQGALSIADSNTQSAAPDLTPRVIQRLQALSGSTPDKPFFLFAHYFDPHGRYMNHPEVKEFGSSLLDKYDSEIAFVDHHLEPVLKLVATSPLNENTLVVISSDHGESFREHGFNFHGRTVYQDEIAVPLIVRAPGVSPGRKDVQLSLVDLMATFAGVAGVPCKGCLGADILSMVAGTGPGAGADRVVFAEALPYPNYEVHMVAGIGADHFKVIRNVTENATELFDTRADPFEKENLLGTGAPSEAALRAAASKFLEGDRGARGE